MLISNFKLSIFSLNFYRVTVPGWDLDSGVSYVSFTLKDKTKGDTVYSSMFPGKTAPFKVIIQIGIRNSSVWQ